MKYLSPLYLVRFSNNEKIHTYCSEFRTKYCLKMVYFEIEIITADACIKKEIESAAIETSTVTIIRKPCFKHHLPCTHRPSLTFRQTLSILQWHSVVCAERGRVQCTTANSSIWMHHSRALNEQSTENACTATFDTLTHRTREHRKMGIG